ncbi:MAG: hypothetical protein JSW58_01090 [Candidatus Latescibacterota bacterium]|nr:MAG: hypothetical protein JSW58_01090 [Candidatus Latescibacterota bacterium]
MSKLRASVVVTGLLAIAALVFLAGGAGELIASTINSYTTDTVTSGSGDDGKSTSGCKKKTASCPKSSAQAASDCSKSCSKTCSKACSKTCSKKSCKGAKSGSAANIETVPYREGRVMVLTGRYVCGNCNLGATKTCHAAFQTSEGKSYLLVKNHLAKKLKRTARETDVMITTRVKKHDGVKYLEVEAIKTL